jgi:hypothetical protein
MFIPPDDEWKNASPLVHVIQYQWRSGNVVIGLREELQ